jgi:Holliday junction DNA helicase RuvB
MEEQNNKTTVSRINQAKLTSFSHLIGQEPVIRTLETAVRAYFNDRMAGRNPRPENVIMVGPPGVGKTTACTILHLSYGFPEEKFKEVIGSSLSVDDLVYLLLSLDQDSTLYIDEAMGLSDSCSELLLKAIDQQILIIGKQRSGKVQRIPLDNFHCVLSLTNEYTLAAPLRQRFPIYCRFQLYDDKSLQKIIYNRSRMCGIDIACPETIIPMLSSRSRQTPRIGIHLLSACWRVARSHEEDCITINHVQEALALDQIDCLGCDCVQQAYLRLLYQANHPIRLNILASHLSLEKQTVSQVVEDWLIRARLIEKLPEGRILTEQGRTHVQQNLL